MELSARLHALAALPDSEIVKARAIFQPQRLPRGGFFVRAGELPQTLGFVVSGLLRLYYLREDGSEYTKSFCVEHEFVGAYRALLCAEPSRLFIQALEPVTLLVARYQDYQTLSAGHPGWETVNRKLAERLFLKKEQRESALLLDDAQTRYIEFLAEYPGLEHRLKQHQIASYLGITPVSLSRIRARLRRLNPG